LPAIAKPQAAGLSRNAPSTALFLSHPFVLQICKMKSAGSAVVSRNRVSPNPSPTNPLMLPERRCAAMQHGSLLNMLF
jgi:hypothetical protein